MTLGKFFLKRTDTVVGWTMKKRPACKQLGVGLLAVMMTGASTSYSSSCHQHMHHPQLQYNPEWRHFGNRLTQNILGPNYKKILRFVIRLS